MAQKQAWEKEYAAQKLMTLGSEPQADVLRFLKWHKKSIGKGIGGLAVLDLGCGTGRNANYLAGLGARVTAIELVSNALAEARQRAKRLDVQVEYVEQSIGQPWPVADRSVDLILDVTSSNSLSEHERELYLAEAQRVLKAGGAMFVRALCKDGDRNAKELLKQFPGPEKDTYVLKGIGIVERVFTEADLRALYGRFFRIAVLDRKSGYQRWGNQNYKRQYWLAYLEKAG